jgi:hypothetical protein
MIVEAFESNRFHNFVGSDAKMMNILSRIMPERSGADDSTANGVVVEVTLVRNHPKGQEHLDMFLPFFVACTSKSQRFCVYFCKPYAGRDIFHGKNDFTKCGMARIISTSQSTCA